VRIGANIKLNNGNLNISADGAISQTQPVSVDGIISVDGITSLSAKGDITLDHDNRLTSISVAHAQTVTLVNDQRTDLAGSWNVMGDLTLTSRGMVTESGTEVTVAGTTKITAASPMVRSITSH